MPSSRNAARPQPFPHCARPGSRRSRRPQAWLVWCLAVAGATLASFALAQGSGDARLEVSSNIQDSYRAGTEHELNVRVALVDGAQSFARGVLFLNVVEIDEAGTHPQAMHKVFASAETEEEVFRVPLEAATLRAGVEATVRVRLRDQAPPGSYSIVIQLFEGNETDPHAVRVENRVAMTSWTFEVVR